MAGDTRDSPANPKTDSTPPQPRGPPPGATAPPPHITSSTPKIYEVFPSPPSPPPSANALPEGSGQNTAGSPSRHEVPDLSTALKTVHIQDFKQVHMYPCVREALLMGIGGGFGVGGIRALLGAPIPKTANWAVGTFTFAALASYEFCFYRRRVEKQHMKRAVEIIDRKKVEKEAEAKRKREERRLLKEEEDRRVQEAKKKGSWKFW